MGSHINFKFGLRVHLQMCYHICIYTRKPSPVAMATINL